MDKNNLTLVEKEIIAILVRGFKQMLSALIKLDKLLKKKHDEPNSRKQEI